MRYIAIIFFVLFYGFSASANTAVDTDHDGIQDKDEIEIYHTDPDKSDTDNDGFSDWVELNNGYSPYNPKAGVKLEDSDVDSDGLSDRMELNFHSNPLVADTDNDGFKDWFEVAKGFDPLNKDKKLQKKIEVDLKQQRLKYYLGDVLLGAFVVSSGKASTPTPKGNFKIDGKSAKAWSRSYGLWLPYWMSLKNGKFGLHELPEWPSGKKEGKNHLGIPVSHGCVRLGVGPAKTLYDWADLGTPVYIY